MVQATVKLCKRNCRGGYGLCACSCPQADSERVALMARLESEGFLKFFFKMMADVFEREKESKKLLISVQDDIIM